MPVSQSHRLWRWSFTVSFLSLLFIIQTACSQPEFTPDSIKKVCMRVADSRLSSRNINCSWQGGAFMDGVMAVYRMTMNRKYLDTAIAWGNYNGWLPYKGGNSIGNFGDTIRDNFDSYCGLHAYFEVFEQDTSPANFNRIKAATVSAKYMTYVDPPPFGGNNNDPTWPIFDHLYMSAPNFAYAARALHDTAMFDSIYSFYKNVANRHHYCARDSLWAGNIFPCSNTDVHYWAQGNGWVSGSLGLIHKNLPKGRAGTLWFESIMKAHVTKLLQYQDATDGMWRSDINHPAVYPSKESSGSGMFLYEILYAINAGIVDRSAFEPAAKKAWTGLLGCMQSNNHIGYAQGAWSGPGPVNPPDNNEWTDGGFCLAGSELFKLVSSTGTSSGKTARDLHTTAPYGGMLLCPGACGRIHIQGDAGAIEVYNLNGRLLYKKMLDEAGKDQTIVLPREIVRSNVAVVRFQGL
jgi:rhamnogalacturonyl hydrolase YesR